MSIATLTDIIHNSSKTFVTKCRSLKSISVSKKYPEFAHLKDQFNRDLELIKRNNQPASSRNRVGKKAKKNAKRSGVKSVNGKGKIKAADQNIANEDEVLLL